MILPGCWQAMHPPLSSSQSPLGSISAWRRKLRPLPCSSSPHRNRSAGFLRGPRLTRQKENGRWSRPREKTLARNLRRAQVRLNTGAVLADCHQFSSLLLARAVFVPRIGFPRVYTAAVNAGGHRKACPPSPVDATLERKRKSAQGVSGTSKTPARTTPRAETFLEPGALPHRETFFLFHRARRIFFLMSQKENGGCIPPAKPASPVPAPRRRESPAPLRRKNPRRFRRSQKGVSLWQST